MIQIRPHASFSTTVECSACTESMRILSTIRAPCGPHYCRPCLEDLVSAATRDESLFPVRCCRQEIPVDSLAQYVSQTLIQNFRTKTIEFGTPAGDRIYCPTPTCSLFLGPAIPGSTSVFCDRCLVSVCVACKDYTHPRRPCEENMSAIKVKDLAQQEGWQTCPGCGAIVDLTYGCYHITCRCRTEFCYLC